MKKIWIVSFFLNLCFFFSFAQDTLRRDSYKLSIAVDRNSVYEEDIKSTPFVLPNKTVQIYPGETIYIEVEQVDGAIKNFTAVKDIKDKQKTLTITFKQISENGIHKSMMLTVFNPFSQKLIYEAKMFLLRQKKWVNTDVYPVEAGLSGIEIWPDIIITLGLGNWRFEK